MIKRQDRKVNRLKRHRRVRVHVAGTSQRPRLAVFRSLNHIYVQLIDDTESRTVAAASTVTCPGARVTFTDFGTWTGSFPIRDNFSPTPYQTNANTSPPRPLRVACLPLMTPSAVLRMAMPRPPRTLGISVLRA